MFNLAKGKEKDLREVPKTFPLKINNMVYYNDLKFAINSFFETNFDP